MDRGSWHYTGGSDQDHPAEKEMEKGKMIGEALYSHQKQDQDVAQIMNSLLPNSDLN